MPKQIDASVYRVEILDEKYTLAQIIDQIAQILSKESLPRVRNKKSYDLRPLIQSLEVRQNGQNLIEITAKMPSNSSQTGRPEEIMAEMGIPLEDFRITRIQLVFLEKYRDSHS